MKWKCLSFEVERKMTIHYWNVWITLGFFYKEVSFLWRLSYEYNIVYSVDVEGNVIKILFRKKGN